MTSALRGSKPTQPDLTSPSVPGQTATITQRDAPTVDAFNIRSVRPTSRPGSHPCCARTGCSGCDRSLRLLRGHAWRGLAGNEISCWPVAGSGSVVVIVAVRSIRCREPPAGAPYRLVCGNLRGRVLRDALAQACCLSCTVLVAVRLSDCCDAGQDEVDAGEELLAVVVPGQLRCHLVYEGVLRGVELRPLCGDGREEGRPVRLAREEAGARSVLSCEAEEVVHERGRAVELRPFGDAECLELAAGAFQDLYYRGLPRLPGELGTHPGVCV